MVYCQQCGASNADDARFCNQCGAKIADAGEPGGRLATDATRPDTQPGFDGADAAPRPRAADTIEGAVEASRGSVSSRPPSHGSFDVSTLSLSSIGVRSRGKAWGVIVLVTLALVGLGAGATWLGMQSSEPEPVATSDETEPAAPNGTDEVEIGDLLPQGEDPPDVVTGTPRPAGARAERPSRGTKSTGTRRPDRGGASGSNGGETASGGAATRQEGGSSSSESGGTSTGGSGGTSTGGSGGTSTGGSGGTSTGGSGGTRPEPDWDAMEEEAAEEVDYEMEAYATRVRSVVRSYYARRAQNCFELATRNHESVRGTVVIGFDIRADGEIVRPEVVRNTTQIDSLGACLRGQVDTWRLPPPPEGRAPLPMQMPFSR